LILLLKDSDDILMMDTASFMNSRQILPDSMPLRLESMKKKRRIILDIESDEEKAAPKVLTKTSNKLTEREKVCSEY
jgi:hypothetical protein